MDAVGVDVPGLPMSDAEWTAFWADCVADGCDDPRSSAAEPTPAVASDPVPDALDLRLFWLSHAVDELLDTVRADAERLGAGRVVSALRGIEQVRRRLPAIEHVLVAQVEQRSLHESYCRPSAAKLISAELCLAPGDAKARVAAARELGPRVALDGQPLAPNLELVAEAQEAGTLSERQAAVIVRTMGDLPAWTGTAVADDPLGMTGRPGPAGSVRDQTELRLVGLAETLDPVELAHAARRVLDHLDPDGREPAAETQRRRRGLSLWQPADGSWRIHGELDHQTGLIWQTVLDPLARPVPAVDGVPDARTPAQRSHDALRTAGSMLLRAGELPQSGGIPATIIVHVDAPDLAAHSGSTDVPDDATSDPGATDAGSGPAGGASAGSAPTGSAPTGSAGTDRASTGGASTDSASTRSASTRSASAGSAFTGEVESAGARDDDAPARDATRHPWAPSIGRSGMARTARGVDWPIGDMLAALGDRAQWVTVFGGPADGVLAYGTDRRFPTPAMTLALIARDRGCTFPGCDVPATWCERHHIRSVVPANPGDPPGRTDLINLALLCDHHHDHFEAAGWQCLMLNGRVHWRPPAHIDPHRAPIRNTHWDHPG